MGEGLILPSNDPTAGDAPEHRLVLLLHPTDPHLKGTIMAHLLHWPRCPSGWRRFDEIALDSGFIKIYAGTIPVDVRGRRHRQRNASVHAHR